MSNSQVLLEKQKSKNISSFLKKTCELLDDPINKNIVKWAPNGKGFMVTNEQQFAKSILPKYFKHSNYSSFVRQLNMYNFHKMRQGDVENCFYHQLFDKNDRKNISEIKRKPQKKKRKNSQSEQDIGDDVSICIRKRSKFSKRKNQDHCQNKNIEKIRENSLQESEPNRSQYFTQTPKNYTDIDRESMKNSEKNILSIDIDDDKLSINEEMVERYPTFQTKDLIGASNNMISFSFPGQLSNFNLLL